ncbi:MAG: trypsin-like serine protease [Polyangiaceae bacterium]
MLATDLLEDPENPRRPCRENFELLKNAVAEMHAPLRILFLRERSDQCSAEIPEQLRMGVCGNKEPSQCSIEPAPPRGPTCNPERIADSLDRLLRVGAAWRVKRGEPNHNFADVVLVGTEKGWFCTAFVVGHHSLLTAKHCGSVTQVGVGDSDTGELRRGRVAQRRPHDVLDVQMLRVDLELGGATHLRRRREDDSAPMGELRAVGFGARDSTGVFAAGRRSIVDLTSVGWGCDGTRAATSGCLEGEELVIPGTPGDDTCRGDSGGPVFELIPSTETRSCDYRLVGLVSRSVPNPAATCGSGGIYVRADRISDWIEEGLASWQDN